MSDIQSNITIHIVEPASPTDNTNTDETIIVQDTDVNVPDTGLFTHGVGGREVAVLGIAIFTILAIMSLAILRYRKKHGKTNKLSNLLKQCKSILKSKKHIAIGLSGIALLVAMGTFAGFIKNAVNAEEADNVEDADATSSLTVTAESEELTIELGNEPVFAVVPVTVTIDEDMPTGYTLKAYSTQPELTAEGIDKTISLVPADSTASTSRLMDNTWGISIEKPETITDKIFYSLPDNIEEAPLLQYMSYAYAGQTVTIYYGIYITPDIPYGTYTGATVDYEIKPGRTDLIRVAFQGNGLYFNNDPSATSNIVTYERAAIDQTVAYSHTPNVNDIGEQDGIYGKNLDSTTVYRFADNSTNIHIKIVKSGNDSACGPDGNDYFTFWAGAQPFNTAKNNYGSAIKAFGNTNGKYMFGNYNDVEIDISDENTITFAYTTSNNQYCSGDGYGYYAIITAQDSNGDSVDLVKNRQYYGDYSVPSSNTSHSFLGWSMNANDTAGTYKNIDDLINNLDANPGEFVILNAIWQPTFTINYNGNGADSTTDMDSAEQHTANLDGTSQVDLLAPNFSREGYGFVGWSTDTEAWEHLTDDDTTNSPTIYGPNQTITIDENLIAEAGENRKLILNAVWAPAEKDNNGKPVSLQNWQGCSDLTATSYDSEAGLLTVGKNTITALTDSRDGNVYTVARLADGNCWMVENLRLDNKPELTSTNTNNPSLPLTNNFAEQNTSNRLSASSDEWCNYDSSAACYNQSKLNTANTAFVTASPVFSQDFTDNAHDDYWGSLSFNIYSYGNYYNWYSATAGQGTYETGSNITVSGDICPASWHLPYGGNGDGTGNNNKGNTNGGFYYLNQQIGGNASSQGSNNWRSFPNNFIYSGGLSGSSIYDSGYSGVYMSSTAANKDDIYYLYISRNNIGADEKYDGSPFGKSRGKTIRCLIHPE